MSYSDITFKDKNTIKRWLQNRRLISACNAARDLENINCILDFGAGNGEFCKNISNQFPHAKIICYEPTPGLMNEARENLKELQKIIFCEKIEELEKSSIDLIFCLEVFEHLPEKETKDALRDFSNLLKVNGKAIIGVPVEIGIPALYKGLFRMTRRFNSFDASVKNVISSTLFNPPKNRPVSEIAPGFSFYFEHMGFDYRKLKSILNSKFRIIRTITSPSKIAGALLNPEIYFLIEKI